MQNGSPFILTTISSILWFRSYIIQSYTISSPPQLLMQISLALIDRLLFFHIWVGKMPTGQID